MLEGRYRFILLSGESFDQIWEERKNGILIGLFMGLMLGLTAGLILCRLN